MSSINMLQVAMDINGPPGLTHPLLIENYAWVDQRLRELFYEYALTDSNCDEYEADGLLTENFAWVDEKLAEMCSISEKKYPLCLTPLTWINYRDKDYRENQDEYNICHKRKRSQSDCEMDELSINKLICQSSIQTGNIYLSNSTDESSLEAVADEDLEIYTVSSIDLESEEDDLNLSIPNSPTSVAELGCQIIPYDEDMIRVGVVTPEYQETWSEQEDDVETHYSYDSY